MICKKLPLFFCFCVVTVVSIAQVENGKNEIGVNAGAMFYQGDMTPDMVGSYKTARPAVGIYYSRILSPYWSVRGNLGLSSLEGDDARNAKPAYMRRRNFNFHTPLAELTAMGVFNVFGNNIQPDVTKLSPYVFAGAGVAFVDIKRDWSRIDTNMIHTGSTTRSGLIRDTTTVLPKAIPVLPVGLGIRYAILPRISLAFEANYRIIFTDYLDGFSYAANPVRKDAYYSVTAGAVYNFGGNGGGGTGLGGGRRHGKSQTGCPKVF
ncbi:hypothetical protein BH10BAC3_BH10BAC3_20460 [soil metagenome]